MDNVKKERDKYATKVFWFALQTSFIFGIPALLGAFIGRKLDAMVGGNWFTIGILAFTFIGSWAIVLAGYYRLRDNFRKIERGDDNNKKENSTTPHA